MVRFVGILTETLFSGCISPNWRSERSIPMRKCLEELKPIAVVAGKTTKNGLKNSTKNFRHDSVLGEGGFGYVFKGWIDEHEFVATKTRMGLVIVVKKLNQEGLQGHKEWLAEVNYLSWIHHPNLVKLIGYFVEDDHHLLVYEFMAKGSLENHLFRHM